MVIMLCQKLVSLTLKEKFSLKLLLKANLSCPLKLLLNQLKISALTQTLTQPIKKKFATQTQTLTQLKSLHSNMLATDKTFL